MTDYRKKLMEEYPKRFLELYGQKRYAEAKYLYDTAVRVTAFLELPEECSIELFGNRGYDDRENNPIEGLFPEEKVQKCYFECGVKRNMGQENMQYRRPVEPVRFE